MSGFVIKKLFRIIHIRSIRLFSGVCRQAILTKGKIMIIAPHPDDEVIGCGGLIARLAAEGNAPHIVVMTGGEGSHRGCCDVSGEEIIRSRRSLTRRAFDILGVPESNLHELNYPDGGIAEENLQTEALVRLIAEIGPDAILVPHWGEGWPDHVKTAEIVKRHAPANAEIWEYCVWMWYYNVWGLDWKNACVLKMSKGEHGSKLAAMDAYIEPLAPCGRPWSGLLPKVFVKANRWNRELYFKTR